VVFRTRRACLIADLVSVWRLSFMAAPFPTKKYPESRPGKHPYQLQTRIAAGRTPIALKERRRDGEIPRHDVSAASAPRTRLAAP
jgi:hypothetical protein